MAEVKVGLTCLYDQIDELLHIRVVTLQVEGDELRDVKLEVLAHWRRQVWVDAAFHQFQDSLGLT